MTDITRQWQKPIYTKELHESTASYYTFKIYCQNPQWSLKTLAQQTNHSYDQVKQWSSKYHYTNRRQAYYEEIHREVEEQAILIRQNELQGYLQRKEEDQALLDDDQYITRAIQKNLKQQLEEDHTPTREQTTIYTTLKDSYTKTKKDHATTTQAILRTITDGVDPDKFDTEHMSLGAKRLVEDLRRIREGENTDDR